MQFQQKLKLTLDIEAQGWSRCREEEAVKPSPKWTTSIVLHPWGLRQRGGRRAVGDPVITRKECFLDTACEFMLVGITCSKPVQAQVRQNPIMKVATKPYP